jgi:ABC-type multidrug transport system fused ATPase/permease subunit
MVSGGQRQRIAIARVILKKPKVQEGMNLNEALTDLI